MIKLKILLLILIIVISSCSKVNIPTVLIKNGCSVDAVAGSLQSSKGGHYSLQLGNNHVLQGWIADVESDKAPNAVQVVAYGSDGKIFLIGNDKVNGSRPDVGNVFGKKNISQSGINVPIDVNRLSPGEYQIQLVGDFSEYNGLCIPQTTFNISN